jgi:putative hydrolase of the HAD superfamily
MSTFSTRARTFSFCVPPGDQFIGERFFSTSQERAMMIEAVILDADGVVIFPWRFARYLEREHGITPEMTRPFFRGIFDDCLVGKADLKDVLPPFLQAWGWSGSLDEFVSSWLETEDAVDDRVIKAVCTLRSSGLICCLATSQERHRAQYMKTTMGFTTVFDRLFLSCELGCQKPDPAYYELIERDLGLEGKRILFWDDSARNVESARKQGWNAEVYVDFVSFENMLTGYLGCKGGSPHPGV